MKENGRITYRKEIIEKKWNEMGRSLIDSKTFFKSQDENWVR